MSKMNREANSIWHNFHLFFFLFFFTDKNLKLKVEQLKVKQTRSILAQNNRTVDILFIIVNIIQDSKIIDKNRKKAPGNNF